MNEFDDNHLKIDADHLRVYLDGAEIRVTLLEWRIILILLKVYPESVPTGELERVIYNGSLGKSITGIYTYIFRLRKLIGVEYIQSLPDGYRFNKKLLGQR